jgi:hypothetical protein
LEDKFKMLLKISFIYFQRPSESTWCLCTAKIRNLCVMSRVAMPNLWVTSIWLIYCRFLIYSIFKGARILTDQT